MTVKIMIKFLFFLFFCFGNLFSKDLIIEGNKKLDSNSLQSLTSIDLFKTDFTSNEVQILLSELYNSELIYNVSLEENANSFILNIEEAKIIQNIYINGNVFINDETINNNIKSKSNILFNRNRLIKDIDSIYKIYLSQGFNDISIKTSTENYSEDRLNIIFEIYENQPSKIIKIDFKGNEFFSDKFLRSLINSSEDSFFNFFSPPTNLDKSVFQFDSSIIKNKYLNYGFNDIRVTYDLGNLSNKNNQILTFYISEGSKYSIKNIQYDLISKSLEEELKPIFDKLDNYLLKNDYQVNQNVIDEYLIEINQNLISKNIFKSRIKYEINFINNGYDVLIYEEISEPLTVKSINILGNSITKDSTIRNSIVIDPGDYFNEYLINKSKKNLQKKKFINKVNVNLNEFEKKVDINFEVDENKKTGNFLIGGNFSGDTGLGLTTSITDNNLFGTGNEVDATLDFNDENVRFDLSYIHYPIGKNEISYEYKIFNLDRDLTSSYGYKNREYGIGFLFNFDYLENTKVSSGVEYAFSEGYSAQDNLNFINDNIKEFNQYIFKLNFSHDTTNDFLYPTNGIKNSLSIKYTPNDISTLSYYSIILKNEQYLEFENSSNFIFNQNIFGYADTLNSNDKLNTINSFSLGGLSFKGFDYRGLGPVSSDYYLGGNQFFTSTFGYGSSFLLDEDNFNFKLFYTLGSIWGSDYTNDSDFELRSSVGISLDVMTPLLPISFSYSLPINKQSEDRVRRFNFSIGTSF